MNRAVEHHAHIAYSKCIGDGTLIFSVCIYNDLSVRTVSPPVLGRLTLVPDVSHAKQSLIRYVLRFSASSQIFF